MEGNFLQPEFMQDGTKKISYLEQNFTSQHRGCDLDCFLLWHRIHTSLWGQTVVRVQLNYAV